MGSFVISVILQLYAELALQRKLKKPQVAAAKHSVELRLKLLVIWFVLSVVLAVIFTPPWFMHNNDEYLQTGPQFWFLVISSNFVLVLISKLQ
jgi:hypothetical protein